MAFREPGDRIATLNRFPVRLERFATVGSTNDLVAGWLRAGTPEVCVAVADTQAAGRGRLGRSWQAPAGAALLSSIGFRPAWLAPDRLWRLGAIVALAMADASEEVAGLAEGTIRLKWPNDLVVAFGATGRAVGGAASLGPDVVPVVRKLAGILGETDGIGGADPRAVVGIGINADWTREAFPADLADDMTSLREASNGRPIDRDALLDAFLAHLEPRVEALRGGWFDVAGWTERQLTNGRLVRLDAPGGSPRSEAGSAGEAGRAGEAGGAATGSSEVVRAVGVDSRSGALLVEPIEGGPEQAILAGEIRHLRLATPVATDRV